MLCVNSQSITTLAFRRKKEKRREGGRKEGGKERKKEGRRRSGFKMSNRQIGSWKLFVFPSLSSQRAPCAKLMTSKPALQAEPRGLLGSRLASEHWSDDLCGVGGT